jgi:hypothetical protein
MFSYDSMFSYGGRFSYKDLNRVERLDSLDEGGRDSSVGAVITNNVDSPAKI